MKKQCHVDTKRIATGFLLTSQMGNNVFYCHLIRFPGLFATAGKSKNGFDLSATQSYEEQDV
jgi:hypothetical protein